MLYKCLSPLGTCQAGQLNQLSHTFSPIPGLAPVNSTGISLSTYANAAERKQRVHGHLEGHAYAYSMVKATPLKGKCCKILAMPEK